MSKKGSFQVDSSKIDGAIAIYPSLVKAFTTSAYIPFKKEFVDHEVVVIVLRK